MSTAPIPPVVRSPLVRDVTDASQNRSKQFIPSAYAVGKLFTGVTLKDDIDLDTYVAPGVSRVNTYKNGPPVTSPGYLVIHTVNPDEDKSTLKYRYRQIYYPDSTTETTPYTRVGNSTDGTTITWSVWTTMGGNWVCEILGGNKTGIVNYMYHSFNSWTLTLPDPKLYVTGTRIGLTQWVNNGKVVWGTNEQVTTPDISEEGTVVGALQYIFQIVPKKQPDGSSVNIWALDVDNNIDGTVEKLVESFQSKVDTINTTITNLTNRVATEEQTRASEDTSIRNEFRAADTAIRNEFRAADTNLNNTFTAIANRKQPLQKQIITASGVTFIADANASDPNNGNNVEFFDYIVVVNGNCTITLPRSTDRRGVRLTILVAPGRTCTVSWTNDANTTTREEFQNKDASAQLVLDFMTHNNPTGTNDWSVLEVG